MEKYIFVAVILLLIVIIFFTMKPSELMICKSKKDLKKTYGKECFVVGTYEIQEFRTKKDIVFANWPVLVLEDSTVVLLESFWEAKDKRSSKENLSFVGKTVKAKGLLHSEPPIEGGGQNLLIPCLTEVEVSLID